MANRKIIWYAAGGGIKQAGPFDDQVAAWEALRFHEKAQEMFQSIHPQDARVWPEYADEQED